MESINATTPDIAFSDPHPLVSSASLGGEASESFSIEISGQGQLTGLSYTIPAHSSGSIKAKLQMSAMTSEDVKNLSELAVSMLDASYQQEIKEYEKTSVDANLSVFSWFFGGGVDSSYEKTQETMTSKGLSEEQITTLMNAFMEVATNMSTVELDFYVNNSANDYAVSGDLYLYTISGQIKTEKGTAQYRMLADQASAGGPPPTGGGAPSTGDVVQIN